jgi:hypothetical protein
MILIRKIFILISSLQDSLQPVALTMKAIALAGLLLPAALATFTFTSAEKARLPPGPGKKFDRES